MQTITRLLVVAVRKVTDTHVLQIPRRLLSVFALTYTVPFAWGFQFFRNIFCFSHVTAVLETGVIRYSPSLKLNSIYPQNSVHLKVV
mmetsp:Transcript_10865/g.12414  ORF Transcript_10865/g.12414 Transcript_10865/m.12414 type:complete len:87 (+) Transcript_10865:713-973(+)